MHHTHRAVSALIAALVVVSGCSDDDPIDNAAVERTTTTAVTVDAPADDPQPAQLLPAEGPLQAGWWASPAFDEIMTIELEDGWSVLDHSSGLVLGFDVDPETGPSGALSFSVVRGVFADPLVPGEAVFASVPGQHALVRPLVDGDLAAHLASLPSTTVSEVEAVDVGGHEGERFTVSVGDLPPGAENVCQGSPGGCVLAYDNPGLFATAYLANTETTMMTLELGDDLVAIERTPPEGDAAAFEEAAGNVLDSLAFGGAVDIDEEAVKELFIAGVNDDFVVGRAVGVAAPGSPARAFIEALAIGGRSRVETGAEPYSSDDLAPSDGGRWEYASTGTVFDDFRFEDGLLADFTVDGEPIERFVGDLSDLPSIQVGTLELQPISTYRSVRSATLRVSLEVVNGDVAVDVSDVRAAMTSADGEVPSDTSLAGVVVPAFYDGPAEFFFPEAAVTPGVMHLRGTVDGEPIDVSVEIPAVDAG